MLIADDEPLFRSALADALSPLPALTILEAPDGLEAWNLLRSRDVDILVTDLGMPGLDGFELLQNVLNAQLAVPIVVVTALGGFDVEARTRDLGALHFIEKPVDFDVLVGTVFDLLDRGTRKNFVTGLTLAGFLQLLHAERKSCVVNVVDGKRRGTLRFVEGDLTHAHVGEKRGNEAALNILAWSGAAIEMRTTDSNDSARARNVSTSLTELLLDAARIHDEELRSGAPSEISPTTARSLGEDDLFSSPKDEPEPTFVSKTLKKERLDMADLKSSVQAALKIDGALGAAVVDFESGMCLAFAGNPGFDLELAAAGNADVVRAKKKIRDKLGLRDSIEDILITLSGQYHLIRMVGRNMFIYLALDRQKANLAMSRKELEIIERGLEVARS